MSWKKYKVVFGAVYFCTVGLLSVSGNPLPHFQQPPAQIPADFPRLSPLLKTSDGRDITTKAAWEKQRENFRAEWLKVLGDFPKKRAPLKTEFLQKEELDGFTRQFVRYQIEEGVFTDGYLLMPKNVKSPLPAVVVFHPTTPLQAKGVAGLSPDYAEEKWQGVQLAQRGYLVWCPRNFIFDEGSGATNGIPMYTSNARRMQQRHPRWTGLGRMTFDAMRAADFVESLPQVDRKRIGCLGHSLGAKVALYAAAFDERYAASVSSEGGIGLKFSNWEAVWYLGEQIKKPSFALENHQVLSLIAPRAFLLLAGDSADNDKSWAFIDAARAVYILRKSPENIGWLNHHLGHRYAPEARATTEAFLDEHLQRR